MNLGSVSNVEPVCDDQIADQFLIIPTESEKKIARLLHTLLGLGKQIQAHDLSKKEFNNQFKSVKLQFKELLEIDSEGMRQTRGTIDLFKNIKKKSVEENFEDVSLSISLNADQFEIIAKLLKTDQGDGEEPHGVEVESKYDEIVSKKKMDRRQEEKYLLCISFIPWVVMLVFLGVIVSNLNSIEKKFS